MDKTKFISLDTSNINDITNDYFNSDQKKRQKSISFIEQLNNSGYKIIFSLNHILELLAHKDKNKIKKSFDIIGLLNHVAIIKSKPNVNSLGSIVDIETFEIEHIQSNKYDIKEVIDLTKKSLYSYVPGIVLINIINQEIDTYIDYAQNMNKRHKEIAFFSHSDSLNLNNDNTLIDFQNIKVNSTEMQLKIKEKLKDKLLLEILLRGDTKIENHKIIINEFIQSLTEVPTYIEKYFFDKNNITKDEYSKLKTFEDFEYLSIFKNRLEIISSSFDDSTKFKIFNLKEKDCPTWLLWRNLHKIRKKALKNNKIEGGNINDLILANFVLYADITVVDKRTFEYLNQLKKQNKSISSLINTFIRVSNYYEILKYL